MMRNLMFQEKFVYPERAVHAIREWKDKGLTTALALGCFDLLHIGCVRFIQEASTYADRLIVGVFDDASMVAVKGDGRPILQLEHRLDMVAAIDKVHAVTPMNINESLAENISNLIPDFLVVGGGELETGLFASQDRINNCRIVTIKSRPDTCSDWLIKHIREKMEAE